MQLFYLEDPTDNIILSTEESKHATKVLRKEIGDILNFTDGKGNQFIGEIISTEGRRTKVTIKKKKKKEKDHNYYLHVAIAPTKNINRFEWFLEKATEIGIDEITPIICERSERKVIKIEREKRILLSAMKQSLKFHLPKLNEIISLNDFVKQGFEGVKYIAHCNNGKRNDLTIEGRSKKTLILIGPEGDFSQKEIGFVKQNQFKAVSLGTSRLRTETAGIIAVHQLKLNNSFY